MTKTILASYGTLVCMAIAMVGVTTVHASEVTGNLSSDTSNNTQTNGSIGGTVSDGSSGSSGGGSRSGGGSSSRSPSGSVLGASTNNTQTPSFPNAGVSPKDASLDPTLWSRIKTLFLHWLSA